MFVASAPWDVTRHRLTFGYRLFGTTSVASTRIKQSKNFLESLALEDGTDMSQNVGNQLPNYTAHMAEQRRHSFLYIGVKASEKRVLGAEEIVWDEVTEG